MAGKSNYDRRTVLKASGTASVVALAGCLGEDDGVADDTATDDTDVDDDAVTDDGDEVQLPDTLTIISPFSPGAGTDVYARAIAEFWPEHLPDVEAVEVENLPGAGGAIGLQDVAGSEPDGEKSLIFAPFNMVSQLTAEIDADYRELSHLGSVSTEPIGIFINDNLGVENYDEFVAEVQTGETMVGTAGVGGMAHIGAAYIGDRTGDWAFEDLNFTHYDGAAGIAQGILQDHIDWVPLNSASSAVAFAGAVENGTPLVLFADEDEYPDWMTDAFQSFAPDLDITNWEEISRIYGSSRVLSDPPGTSNEIVEIKQNALMEMAEDPEFVQFMEDDLRSVFDPATAEGMEYEALLDDIMEVLTTEPISNIVEEV